jgi:hypothetical protein
VDSNNGFVDPTSTDTRCGPPIRLSSLFLAKHQLTAAEFAFVAATLSIAIWSVDQHDNLL